MEKKILALVIGGVLSAGAQAAITDVIITEYIESSKYNSNVIELTNTGGSDYSFTDKDRIEYSSYSNEVLDPSGRNVLAGQVIKAGKTLVIYDGKMDPAKIALIQGDKVAATSYKLLSEHKYNHLGFSGDDSVVLKHGVNVVDVIGIDGSKWGENKAFIRRKTNDGSIPTGDSIRYIAENWEEKPTDVYTDLGTTTYGSNAALPAPPVVFEITTADEGSFPNALARYVNQEVIINLDINPVDAEDQSLVITRSFGFNVNGYSNNMSAAYKHANIQPNQVYVAGSSFAAKQQLDNEHNTLIIDSFFAAEDGEIAYYPTFHTDAANNAIRIGDKINSIQGVVVTSEHGYKLLVTKTIDSSNFVRAERPESPDRKSVV